MRHHCTDGREYEWEPRIEQPVSCPRCKARLDFPQKGTPCPSCGGSGEGRRPEEQGGAGNGETVPCALCQGEGAPHD